jgi:hypothetical protein
MALHAGSDAVSNQNNENEGEVTTDDLESMASRDGFVLEDKEDLTKYLRNKRHALPLISEAMASLHDEFPGASFTVSYSDDLDPFVTIMVYDAGWSDVCYRKLRKIASGFSSKAGDVGAGMLIMPGV